MGVRSQNMQELVSAGGLMRKGGGVIVGFYGSILTSSPPSVCRWLLDIHEEGVGSDQSESLS